MSKREKISDLLASLLTNISNSASDANDVLNFADDSFSEFDGEIEDIQIALQSLELRAIKLLARYEYDPDAARDAAIDRQIDERLGK